MINEQAVDRILTKCQQDAVTEISAALAVWVDAVRMMRTLDRDLARELAACRSPSEAVEICSRWTAHRLDSLFALQSRVLEIWLACASRAALDLVVSDANRELNGASEADDAPRRAAAPAVKSMRVEPEGG
jgi:hypothetical protein